MEFNEQYKSPEWQKKRLEILERDEFKCTSCGNSENQLHVHHYFYIKKLKVWEHDNMCLTTMCDDCHKLWHDINNSIKFSLAVDPYTLGQISNILDELTGLNPYKLSVISKIIHKINKL